MKTSKIKTSAPFNELFPIKDEQLAAIQSHMGKFGYDKSQPVVLWRGHNIVLDGHTRLQAAFNLGIDDIPTVLHSFDSEDDALQYAIHNQRDRRNLTDAELYGIIQLVDERKQRGGDRKGEKSKVQDCTIDTAEDTGKVVGVSGRKVKQTRTIMDHADEETKEAVKSGKTSINKAYNETQEKRKQKNKSTFNRTNDNIEWAWWTWNPVVGCEHGCKFCYARDMAMRFYKTFKYQFFEERLAQPFNTSYKKIEKTLSASEKMSHIGYKTVFVCSMADLFGEWVPSQVIQKIINVVEKANHWNFIFLTKNPTRYKEFIFPPNAWIGATATTQKQADIAIDLFESVKTKNNIPGIKFISFEPLLERINFPEIYEKDHTTNYLSYIDWIIVGGQSSTSKVKEFTPHWSWVESLLKQARQAQIKVYFKPNLKSRPTEYPQITTRG